MLDEQKPAFASGNRSARFSLKHADLPDDAGAILGRSEGLIFSELEA
jgi:hypothetical protein